MLSNMWIDWLCVFLSAFDWTLVGRVQNTDKSLSFFFAVHFRLSKTEFALPQSSAHTVVALLYIPGKRPHD